MKYKLMEDGTIKARTSTGKSLTIKFRSIDDHLVVDGGSGATLGNIKTIASDLVYYLDARNVSYSKSLKGYIAHIDNVNAIDLALVDGQVHFNNKAIGTVTNDGDTLTVEFSGINEFTSGVHDETLLAAIAPNAILNRCVRMADTASINYECHPKLNGAITCTLDVLEVCATNTGQWDVMFNDDVVLQLSESANSRTNSIDVNYRYSLNLSTGQMETLYRQAVGRYVTLEPRGTSSYNVLTDPHGYIDYRRLCELQLELTNTSAPKAEMAFDAAYPSVLWRHGGVDYCITPLPELRTCWSPHLRNNVNVSIHNVRLGTGYLTGDELLVQVATAEVIRAFAPIQLVSNSMTTLWMLLHGLMISSTRYPHPTLVQVSPSLRSDLREASTSRELRRTRRER